MIAIRYLPSWLKRFLRIVMYGLIDSFDNIAGRREPMVPPRMTSLIVGAGDFKEIGKQYRDYLIRYAGLSPNQKVLEIGAGWGRMAVGLAGYLSPQGSYDGIEIIRKAVNWCTKEISSRHSNFRFHHADVNNPYSNPEGGSAPNEYKLPFAESSFDVVFLTSVFSHMLPKDIDAYLAEISRVLKPNGQCFITYYLLNEFSLKQIDARQSCTLFNYSFDGYRSSSKRVSENTIAVPENEVLQMYNRHNLKIVEPLLYGSWSGREEFLGYQDVIVAYKMGG